MRKDEDNFLLKITTLILYNMEETKKNMTPETKEAVLNVLVNKSDLQSIDYLIKNLRSIYYGYAEDHLAAGANVSFDHDTVSDQLFLLREFIERIELFSQKSRDIKENDNNNK